MPSSRGSFQPRDQTLISCVSHVYSLPLSHQGQPLGGPYFKQTPDVEKSRHIFIQASEFVFKFILKNDCCCCCVASVVSDSVWPQRWQPTRLPCPWDSPGKNTGVGCHFLLQCMKVKSESEVTQSCPTLSDLMDCSLPGSSVRGIFQARVLEWGAIAFSDKEWLRLLNFPITKFPTAFGNGVSVKKTNKSKHFLPCTFRNTYCADHGLPQQWHY